MNKLKKLVKTFTAFLFLIIGLLFAISMPVHASSGAINSDIGKFGNLSGDAYYINCADGYALDMEETGLLDSGDAIINSIANIIFSFIKWIGQIVTSLFYFCMDFDLSNLFQNEINTIQKTLNNNVFKPMFMIGFCGCAVVLLKKMFRKDLMGAYGEIFKVIGIVVLSMLVVRESATVLSMTTNITKSISTKILVGMQGNGNVNDTATYAANCAGTLWVNLVHQPWEFIEFGSDTVDENFVRSALTDKNFLPKSEARAQYIKDYKGNAFSKERAGEKVAFMIMYLIPFLIKSVIYIVMAIISIAFQLIAVFYVVLAPIVLILAMFPGYEGILSAWLKKILESQLSILIISFVIGLLIKVDDMLYTNCATKWGWLIVMVVQVGLAVTIVLKRDEILGSLSKVQKAAANPQYANTMLRNGNTDAISMSYKALNTSVRKGGYALMRGAEIAGTAAVTSARGIKDYGETVSDGAYAYKQATIMEAASSYQIDTGKAAVERPVMSQVKRVGQPQNAPVSASEAQISAKQDEMVNSNIIHVEPLNGRLERSENITRPNLWKEQENNVIQEISTNETNAKRHEEVDERIRAKVESPASGYPVKEPIAVGATQRNIEYSEQSGFSTERMTADINIYSAEPIRPRMDSMQMGDAPTEPEVLTGVNTEKKVAEKEVTGKSSLENSREEPAKPIQEHTVEKKKVIDTKSAEIRSVQSIPGENVSVKVRAERVAKSKAVQRPKSSVKPGTNIKQVTETKE